MGVDVEKNLNYDLDEKCLGTLTAEPFGSIHYYHREDKGANRELAVMFHGFNFYMHLYAPLINKLSEKFDVITCDLPGHGETSAMTDVKNYTPDNFILCLQKVVEHCEPSSDRKFHLVGHSMGGLLSGLAATKPFFKSRLLSLTMCCPAGISLVEGMDSKFLKTSLGQKIAHSNLDRSYAMLTKSMEKRTYKPLPNHISEKMRMTYDAFLEKHSEKLLLRTFHMIPNFPWSSCHNEFMKLAELDVPITLWLSQRDKYVGTKKTAKFFSQPAFNNKVKIIIEKNSLHDLPVLIPTKVVNGIGRASTADVEAAE